MYTIELLELSENWITLTNLINDYIREVNNFHIYVTSNNIIPILDAGSNLSLEIPNNMSPGDEITARHKVLLFDQTINHTGTTIRDLFHRSFQIENNIKQIDPNFHSMYKREIHEQYLRESLRYTRPGYIFRYEG